MNLLQKIKSTFFSTDAQAAPEPASFATRSDTIYAPTSGVLVSIQEINDGSSPPACSATATASSPSATPSTRRPTAAWTRSPSSTTPSAS